MHFVLVSLLAVSMLVACNSSEATEVAQPRPDVNEDVRQAAELEPVVSHLLYVLDPRGGNATTQIHVVDPAAQGVIHTIEADYDPQIIVSPDGGRLYLTDMRSDGTDKLSIIETGTWRLIEEIDSPNRIKHKVYGSDAMAFSPDGRYFYIHKWEVLPGGERFTGPGGYSAPKADHWWDIFDTTTGQFSSNPPHIPDCRYRQGHAPIGRQNAGGALFPAQRTGLRRSADWRYATYDIHAQSHEQPRLRSNPPRRRCGGCSIGGWQLHLCLDG